MNLRPLLQHRPRYYQVTGQQGRNLMLKCLNILSVDIQPVFGHRDGSFHLIIFLSGGPAILVTYVLSGMLLNTLSRNTLLHTILLYVCIINIDTFSGLCPVFYPSSLWQFVIRISIVVGIPFFLVLLVLLTTLPYLSTCMGPTTCQTNPISHNIKQDLTILRQAHGRR